MALSICNTVVNRHGEEILTRGSNGFPVASYHNDLQNAPVPWHWHDEFELAFVEQGCIALATVHETYYFREGEGLFFNCGVLHSLSSAEGSECKMNSIVFHPRVIGGSIESVFWQDFLQPLTKNASLQVVRIGHANAILIQKAWDSCVEEAFGYEFQVRNLLSELIFQIGITKKLEDRGLSPKAFRDQDRIKKMLELIHEHFSEPLTTKRIASSADISESECLRCFHNTIGITPSQYLLQFRLQRAAEQLRMTHKSVAEIGFACGFQEMSYFARRFKETYNSTPTEYRNAKRERHE